tara:strand:- start:404 stop:961 length:558 start_codon:yes stop_codon:yes gene_type:complete
MKLSYLIKATPFLSTLVLIIFLSISNQKEYTKIKILIWSTPSLTLGNYLAISTGTGFILSYLITTKLGKIIQTSKGQVLEFKEEAKYEESPDYKEALKNTNHSYDNTLIERDIKDPSPTINASFRVIGRTERSSFNYKTSNNDEAEYEGAFEFDDDLDEQFVKNETINQPNSIMSDWDDETYSAW